jgi:hypothetical protein
MPPRYAIALSVLLLAVCGYVHGRWTDRWQKSTALEEAVARVVLVPLVIDDWHGEAVEADARSFAQAGAQSYWMRVYKHVRTRQSAMAILMCGRAGHMAVHTPEICYGGAGYELYDRPSVTPVRAESGTELGKMFTARFTKAAGLGSDLRLYWGWNPGDGWQAPRSPRWEFRGRPYLYKLYVSHDQAAAQNRDASAELLGTLLPALEKTLLLDER